MKNLLVSAKRFLSNKNTVTIIGVLVGVVILYIGYNWRINQAITPVAVPYAKEELASRTMITAEMIGTMEIPQSMVSASDNLITSSAQVINQYVSFATSIPKNGLFYKELIMKAEEMPDSAFADIPDNYTIYSLGVNLHTTYGNSIFPGNYIDLYLKAADLDGKVIFGKFIESIEVLAVKDSQGQHVFETTVESRTPSELLFAVPDNMYLLLMKAGYVTGGVEILPIPRNASYSENPGETSVSSTYIQEFIENQSRQLDNEYSVNEYLNEDVDITEDTEITD